MPNIVSICGGVYLGQGSHLLGWEPGCSQLWHGFSPSPALISTFPAQAVLVPGIPNPSRIWETGPGKAFWMVSCWAAWLCCTGWWTRPGPRQRSDALHTRSTGISPPCQTLPGLGPTHWAGVPSLTSWFALRAWIRAQTPVISAMCTENINRPFHQLPALSSRCGQMPGKPLTGVCGLLLPRFTACGQEQHDFFCWLCCSQGLSGVGTAKRRCYFMAALL